jgi:hypothetical protein
MVSKASINSGSSSFVENFRLKWRSNQSANYPIVSDYASDGFFLLNLPSPQKDQVAGAGYLRAQAQ